MKYIIGSFNLRDFNYANTSSDGERLNRDFEMIADIIRQEKFDVVAVQEVNSESAIRHLTDVLNQRKGYFSEWEYTFSGKAANAIRDPEGYGFLWNRKRLRLLDLPRKNNPDYYNFAGGKGILRPPYYARFTSRGMLGGTNFELRLVNVHIRDAIIKDQRQEEFEVLVKQVLPRICDHQELSTALEMMPAYTFLLGDYNLCLDKKEGAKDKIGIKTTTCFTGKKRDFKTVQEEKTSLKMPNGQTELSDCYASNYDHFTYEYDLIPKLKLAEERVEALGKYFSMEGSASDMLEAYRMKVSDHVPIKMTVELR